MNWGVTMKCTVVDDGVEREYKQLIATFTYPLNAQDFIEKCLPEENRDRFEIVNLDSYTE